MKYITSNEAQASVSLSLALSLKGNRVDYRRPCLYGGLLEDGALSQSGRGAAAQIPLGGIPPTSKALITEPAEAQSFQFSDNVISGLDLKR